jgi:hypothetical protein
MSKKRRVKSWARRVSRELPRAFCAKAVIPTNGSGKPKVGSSAILIYRFRNLIWRGFCGRSEPLAVIKSPHTEERVLTFTSSATPGWRGEIEEACRKAFSSGTLKIKN